MRCRNHDWVVDGIEQLDECVVAYVYCRNRVVTDSHVDPHNDEVYEESTACGVTRTYEYMVDPRVSVYVNGTIMGEFLLDESIIMDIIPEDHLADAAREAALYDNDSFETTKVIAEAPTIVELGFSFST